jgi:hypothetical protein
LKDSIAQCWMNSFGLLLGRSSTSQLKLYRRIWMPGWCITTQSAHIRVIATRAEDLLIQLCCSNQKMLGMMPKSTHYVRQTFYPKYTSQVVFRLQKRQPYQLKSECRFLRQCLLICWIFQKKILF